jgi:uncharacterized protein (DUF1810 family)
MTTDDPFELSRFVRAQDAGGTYERALAELRDGCKHGHWMWFVFPQVSGLGFSHMSRRYAISSLDEAQAYLAHPVLGPRLIECATVVAENQDSAAEDIFGEVDALKLRSCATLFHRAAPDEPVFSMILATYFEAEPDPATDQRL